MQTPYVPKPQEVLVLMDLNMAVQKGLQKIGQTKIQKKLLILSIAIAIIGVLGDQISTKIALQFPEFMYEANPSVRNFMNINPVLPMVVEIVWSVPIVLVSIYLYKKHVHQAWILPLFSGAIKVFCMVSNIVNILSMSVLGV